MKKNTVKALAAAMLICMTGCAKTIEEEPVEPSETSAAEISEPEISEENTSEESVSEDTNVTEPDEKKPDAEDFFAFFSGADPVSGRIADNMDDIHSTLFCGLGGSLDVFAGVAQRAPEFYCKHNLEWFYRLVKNPSRAGRMMKLPLFLVHVKQEKRRRK